MMNLIDSNNLPNQARLAPKFAGILALAGEKLSQLFTRAFISFYKPLNELRDRKDLSELGSVHVGVSHFRLKTVRMRESTKP